MIVDNGSVRLQPDRDLGSAGLTSRAAQCDDARDYKPVLGMHRIVHTLNRKSEAEKFVHEEVGAWPFRSSVKNCSSAAVSIKLDPPGRAASRALYQRS
jgi:hypothetical protein